MISIILHLIEHLSQFTQVYILGWERAHAMGFMGLFYPHLVHAEWFHFSYAFEMLIGLLLFKMSFGNSASFWWKITIWIQLWHVFEHSLLFFQELSGAFLLGRSSPTSLIQLIVPRVELHLFYNLLVLAPMLIALFFKYFRNNELYVHLVEGAVINERRNASKERASANG